MSPCLAFSFLVESLDQLPDQPSGLEEHQPSLKDGHHVLCVNPAAARDSLAQFLVFFWEVYLRKSFHCFGLIIYI